MCERIFLSLTQVLMFLMIIPMQAQELTVKSFVKKKNDLAASTNEREDTLLTFADSVLSVCRDSLDRHRKTYIVDYLNQIVTSFGNKGLGFLPDFLKEVGESMILNSQKRDCKRFIRRIKKRFGKDSSMVTSLDGVDIVRHPIEHKFNGVTFHIQFGSGDVSVGGYMFMLWDFFDENHPLIHIRTWQPDVYDADRKRVKRISKDKIFSLIDFDV